MILLKNAMVFAPEALGQMDVLLGMGKIVKMAKNIDKNSIALDIEEVDCEGKCLIPGFIDQHVHMIGGGGEAGFHSRTPEVLFSKVVEAGITTMLGVLGTDGTTRHLESLLAKARALEIEGISTYILTGSYEVPVNTLCGSIRRDIILIDKVIGVGEIAISDHRSSQPTKQELKRIATEARLGGMLSAKCGITQFHLGDGKSDLKMLFEIIEETEIPMRHLVPTHVNRNPKLFEDAIRYAKAGGYIDITSGISNAVGFGKAVKPSKALKECLENGVNIDNITMSSDGNGSMAQYNDKGQVERLLVTTMDATQKEMRDAVIDEGIDMSNVVKTVTENVAKVLGLYPKKGCIKEGSDADILVLDKDLAINSVIAKGAFLMRDKEVLVKGTFEE